MAKAVFTTKLSPSYDDVPEERYHFPRTYLRVAESAVDDLIVYYEPRRSSAALSSRGGRQAYFAVARVVDIQQDRRDPDQFYAIIAPQSYLSFDSPVPFRTQGGTYERILTREDGGTSKGAFGRSVRALKDDEFEAILAAGFVADQWEAPGQQPSGEGVAEAPGVFVRPLVEQTSLRPFRDAAFRRAVRRAYDNRCAFTGLALINGGGRPEVQAAHIRPVEHDGPDSIRNGLALSGTMHWLFDRGLITVADDGAILTAKGALPDQVLGLLNPDGRVRLPIDTSETPHPMFLKHHREVIATGKAWIA